MEITGFYTEHEVMLHTALKRYRWIDFIKEKTNYNDILLIIIVILLLKVIITIMIKKL